MNANRTPTWWRAFDAEKDLILMTMLVVCVSLALAIGNEKSDGKAENVRAAVSPPSAWRSHETAAVATLFTSKPSVISLVPAAKGEEAAADLPANLLIPLGTYLWRGESWVLETPGLVRFSAGAPFGEPGASDEQRILYDPANPDLRALFSAFAWIHTHGARDNKDFAWRKYVGVPESVAGGRTPVMTCGYVADWVSPELNRIGIKTRVVQGLTLDEWNSHDNGHVWNEVLEGGRWVAYDVDRNCFYLDPATGRQLNAVEICRRVRKGESYEIVPLALDHLTPAEPPRWRKRTIQVPLVSWNGRVYWYSTADDPSGRAASYAPGFFNPISEEEFQVRFYRDGR